MGMGLCGGTVRYERSSFLEKVFSKKRPSMQILIDDKQLPGNFGRCRPRLFKSDLKSN